MGSGDKCGYSAPSRSAPEPKLTSEQKRKQKRDQDIKEARKELQYLKDRLRKLREDTDDILQQLPKRDYDRFKTLSRKDDKEIILQQLRTVDYNRFQKLRDDEDQIDQQIKTASMNIKELELDKER